MDYVVVVIPIFLLFSFVINHYRCLPLLLSPLPLLLSLRCGACPLLDRPCGAHGCFGNVLLSLLSNGRGKVCSS